MHVYSSVEYVCTETYSKLRHKIKYKTNKTLQTKKKPELRGAKTLSEDFSRGWPQEPRLKVLRPDARLAPTWKGL